MPFAADRAGGSAAHPDVDMVINWMAGQSRALTLALAQTLPHARPQLAAGQIRTAAISAAVLGAEPVPLVDVPLLLLVQHQLLRRIAAMYDRPAPALFSREGAGMLTWGLATRYGAQQALKLVPLVGWLLSAGLSGASTWLLGRALVLHYEGTPLPLAVRASAWMRAAPTAARAHSVRALHSLRRRAGGRRRRAMRKAEAVALPVTEIPLQGDGVCPNGVDSSRC
ncbi:MAG: hypothetical protein R2838_26550 [Caldilineaceae bacterium]